MKRTIINHLLLFLCCCFVSSSFAQYDQRCFIVQFKAGTTQAEIDELLTPLHLFIEDGPTIAFNNQFSLVCLDTTLGLPPIATDNNGQIDINGVILAATGTDIDNNNILDAIGLNHNVSSSPPPTGNPSSSFQHPLAECGEGAFSIDTNPGTNQRKIGLLDTGIKADPNSELGSFFDPYALGWNILEDTFDPADDNGHGTHMASSIALATPADFPSVLTLKAYKTHDINGLTGIWEFIKGIDKAILDGVEIINMSNSYQSTHAHRDSDAPLKAAIEEALDIAGILFIAAAGNNGADNDSPTELSNYPASFPTDNILSVAAVNCYYEFPTWANYGSTSVDIAAPGVDIWGINFLDLQYVKMSGSSSAVSITSRVAAMLATQQTQFDYTEIKCAIINGANQPFYGQIETLSGGYLDAATAQLIFNTHSPCSASIPSDSAGTGTGTGSGEVGGGSNSGSGLGSATGRTSDNALDATIQNGDILNIDSDKEQIANLGIFNILGQRLYSKEIILQEGQNSFVLEIPDYPFTATYICQLQYGTQNKTIKFVK